MQHIDEQPLVSVVIASYNMGQYLPVAVRSVCEGDYRNIEVIIIDDGSSDDTGNLIQPCLEDPRVRYIYQENLGQPKAKNNGVRVATGEFIAFCDADDLWTPNKLASQIPCFELSSKIGVVSSDISCINENGSDIDSPELERHSGNITNELMMNNCISFGTAVVKRECFDKVGIFDENLPMGIDWDLWMRMSLHFEFYHLDEVTYQYRVWSGQMSSNNRERYVNAELILSNFIRNNPGAVSDVVIRDAWADLYARKGRAIYFEEGVWGVPFRSFCKALSYKPWSLLTWKSIARLVLGGWSGDRRASVPQSNGESPLGTSSVPRKERRQGG